MINHPAELALDLPFLAQYRAGILAGPNKTIPQETFTATESIFLGCFQIGLLEIYQFLFNDCKDDAHLKEWLINLKGLSFYNEKVLLFNRICQEKSSSSDLISAILSTNEMELWQQQGFLHLKNIIEPKSCLLALNYLCTELGVNIADKTTWYPDHQKWQGFMVQIYQHESFNAIRQHEKIKAVFSQLYNSNNIVANCDKTSYNPPETPFYKFRGSGLHWDIDFEKGPRYYIQGLVYLNDVPLNRGPLTVVPGFQHKLSNLLTRKFNQQEAIKEVLETEQPIGIEGKQGDLIVWLEALPHAASPNHSDLPRFVQYVSFTKF